MKIKPVIKKSPIRYAGGKSRARKYILPLIPEDEPTLLSPFFGGGSVEIALAECGINIIGYDIFEPLVNFWKIVFTNASEIAEIAKPYYPLEKEMFSWLKRQTGGSDIERAARFYIINRASFSGTTYSGGMSPSCDSRFNLSAVEYLASFKIENISVEYGDFHNTLLADKDTMVYADPPYMISSSIYGIRGSTHINFDHDGLYTLLSKRDKWILTYNNCDTIKAMYSNYHMLSPEWKYGMRNGATSNELIILSPYMYDYYKNKRDGLD